MLHNITPVFQGITASINEMMSKISTSFNKIYEVMRDLNVPELLSKVERKCLEALEYFVQQGWFIF